MLRVLEIRENRCPAIVKTPIISNISSMKMAMSFLEISRTQE